MKTEITKEKYLFASEALNGVVEKVKGTHNAIVNILNNTLSPKLIEGIEDILNEYCSISSFVHADDYCYYNINLENMPKNVSKALIKTSKEIDKRLYNIQKAKQLMKKNKENRLIEGIKEL